MTNKQAARQTAELAAIKTLVAQISGIPAAKLYGEGRTTRIAETRQIAMAIARKRTSASFHDLAEAFGKKNHGTIMHACSTVRNRRGVDLAYNDHVLWYEDRVAQALREKEAR